jgi:hypothetical protein
MTAEIKKMMREPRAMARMLLAIMLDKIGDTEYGRAKLVRWLKERVEYAPVGKKGEFEFLLKEATEWFLEEGVEE